MKKFILHLRNLINCKDKLNAKQKESLFLLAIGTFLDCFDLFLYMHMAVLLNGLFFPQADPLIAELLAAVAFCSAYVCMPIGGFVIDWIGGHVGHRNTTVITTLIMALCCFAMANVEAYSDIGILSVWIVIICRMLQGFSSFGETVGPQLYLAETLKQPLNYFATGIITLSARIAGLFALAVAASSSNWRIAFCVGTIIAVIGGVARSKLREAQEFANFKLRIFKKKEQLSDRLVGHKLDLTTDVGPCHVSKATVLSYFIIQFNLSVGFYIAYIYAGSFMQDKLGMTPEQVIAQNLKLTLVFVIVTAIVVILFVRKYHPLKIARLQVIALLALLPFLPYWLRHTSSLVSLSLFQFVVYLTTLTPFCMDISCFKHIPVEKRFTILTTTFGLGTALGNIVASIGIIALTSYFGYYGILVIMVPVTICVFFAISHIRKLEIKEGLYHDYPDIHY